MSDLCTRCKKNSIDYSRSVKRCTSCLDKHNKFVAKSYKKHRNKKLERTKKYYQENIDKERERLKKYRIENKEKELIRHKKYREENKDKIYAYSKIYRMKNNRGEYFQKYFKDNHDIVLQRSKKWASEHLEYVNKIHVVGNHRRRAKIGGGGGKFTISEWDELKKKYNNQCLGCGATNVKLETDHIVPIIKGGTSNIDNIQPLCKSCNAKKHIKIINYRERFDLVREWT